MKEITVQLENLMDADLTAYGQAVGKTSDQAPDSSGEGWRCWFPLGSLEMGKELQLGLVLADLHEPLIGKVEAHPTRQELVYAIDAPVVQVVALNAEGTDSAADANTARAILLQPGEGLIINAGVWHAPAFHADLDAAQYGFILAVPDPAVDELGMIPFASSCSVRVTGEG